MELTIFPHGSPGGDHSASLIHLSEWSSSHTTNQRAEFVVEAGGEVKRFVETGQPENNKGIPVGMPLLLKPKRDRF
jgi:hypothetical protein